MAGQTALATVLVCQTCRLPDDPQADPRPGAMLLDAVRATADATIAVKGVACLGNCKRALSAAITKPGGWTYVFGDLSRDSAADLLAGAALFARVPDAIMPFRERPEALKRGLVARIPSLAIIEDLS